MNGVIVVNKPQKFTSFDVVAVMRRLCRQRKIGHTGTLDPMATGVLPLLLGSASKAQDILPDSDKTYVAGFKLGVSTDTLDIWGTVQGESTVRAEYQQILSLLPKYTGDIMQVPPMYSAVKKDGVRLYDLARQGIEIEREPRQVNVSVLKLLDFDDDTAQGRLYISCSKGTYIRAIIDDIGRDLGCGAVMTSLVRTRACGFSLEDALSLDEIRDITKDGEQPDNILGRVHGSESLFLSYRGIKVSEKQAFRFANGNPIDIVRTQIKNSAVNGEIIRVSGRDNNFLGLGRADTEKGLIKIYKLFPTSD